MRIGQSGQFIAINLERIWSSRRISFLSIRSPRWRNRKKNVFPVVSNLYHTDLSSLTPGSVIALQSLRDAFIVAHYVVKKNNAIPMIKSHEPSVPNVELPQWFPFIPSGRGNDVTQRPQYIFCHQDTMSKLLYSGHQKVSEICGELFSQL